MGEGELRLEGIRCPFMSAAILCDTRVCIVCKCGEQVERCARVEVGGLELFLDCNCRREAGLSLCHVRSAWERASICLPVRKEAPVEPPFPALPGRVRPRPSKRGAVPGAPHSSNGE